MQVTIVAHDVAAISGMERQLVHLVEGLVARDVSVRVLSRSCAVAADDLITHVPVGGPVRPFTLGFPTFAFRAARRARHLPKGLVHVIGGLAPIHADVVGLHFLHAGAEAAGAAVNLSTGGRLHQLNQAVARREFAAAERWQLDPRHHRAIVAVSGGLAAEVREHYPRASPPIVIANGIDVNRFRPGPADPAVRRALCPPGAARLAVFVGGGWVGKGLSAAIAALADAPTWGLAVVGPGHAAPFLAEADRLGVADRLRFTGPREDLPAVMRSVDALVLPSAYETFSLVAYEAAACGCPVLATRVSGITDFLVDGRTGFFVDATGTSVAEGLQRLDALGDAAVRAVTDAAGTVARERTTDAMVEAHIDLYRALATRSG